MAVNANKITIVGCGPGSPLYVTEAARQAVAGADVLVGSRRLLELFPQWPAERIVVDADIACAAWTRLRRCTRPAGGWPCW